MLFYKKKLYQYSLYDNAFPLLKFVQLFYWLCFVKLVFISVILNFSFSKKVGSLEVLKRRKMHFDSYCKYASKLYQQVYCEEEEEDQTSDEICDEHCHQKEVRNNFAQSLFCSHFYRKLWQIFLHCQSMTAWRLFDDYLTTIWRLFDDCLMNACLVPDDFIT